MTKEKGVKWKAFTTAFPYTIPIFTGFWFLGLTYGIYMNVSGFSFWYPMLMSITIFAGSIEFVTVNMLLGAFNPIQALTMTLMINARHLFYGISMLNQLYWVSGSTLGGIFGSLIKFNTDGLEFVMVAMFVVIFMEQWLKEKNHTSAVVGIVLSVLCLMVFGSEDFIIPSMIAILGVLTLMRGTLDKKEGELS